MGKETDQLSKIWRALIEFDMLHRGDRILIGLSGGKDSMFLASALARLRRHAPIPFDLACLTVNTKFSPDFPAPLYEKFCRQLGLAWYSEEADVPHLMRPNTSPCYSCAYFRRAIMNRKAGELGCNKVALAHHHDDAVHTFLLNLLTSGQQKTFLPVTFLSRTGITVIRPLIYCREEEIRRQVQDMGLTPIKNPCPYDGHTRRQDMKNLIARLQELFPEVYDHLGAGMRLQKGMELWPAKLTKEELVDKFHHFWKEQT